VLKSRALLPRPDPSSDDEATPDLVRQLEDYRAMKAASAMLAGRQRTGLGVFGRGEGVSTPGLLSVTMPIEQPSALARAVDRWLNRLPARPTITPFARAVSLREMTTRITHALRKSRRLSFNAIRATCASRQEIATAFLALLVMIRRETVVVSQETLFGSISIGQANPGTGRPSMSVNAARSTSGDERG
jgi:chromatin segregation and condensation protein Rec8/ScpA/Scc1 (kleisin family)